MSNTLLRQWAMLRHVPRYPARINTRALMTRLEEQGFQVSQRTIQRDLKALAGLFPGLQSDENRDMAGWFWSRECEVNDFPAIDPPMAFTFKLAELFLGRMMPPAVIDQLHPYLACSERVLESVDNEGYTGWAGKVRIVPRNQPLIPARIDPEVIPVVYGALLEGRQFRGRYRRRDGDVAEYRFHPLGLVFRDSVIYLVATVWDYPDPRHYALHRFEACELLEQAAVAPDGFDLDSYVKSGVFEYLGSGSRKIRISVLFARQVALHLQETPLSDDQKMTPKGDDLVQVTATVNDSQQLRWWLLAFGDQVEVLKPKRLREEFRNISAGLCRKYG